MNRSKIFLSHPKCTPNSNTLEIILFRVIIPHSLPYVDQILFFLFICYRQVTIGLSNHISQNGAHFKYCTLIGTLCTLLTLLLSSVPFMCEIMNVPKENMWNEPAFNHSVSYKPHYYDKRSPFMCLAWIKPF